MKLPIWLPLLGLALLFAGNVRAQINITVASDGSGRFKTVQDAIMSVPSGSATNAVIIHLKPGTYRELIYVQREKQFFHLVGDNPTNTVIVYGLYAGMTNLDHKPIGTFHTPTTTIDADDFTAENITFENSAGPVGQALAIRVDGDRATFRNCHFVGWYLTAASTPKDVPYGFVFSHCQIVGENPGTRTCLGRPWRIYASTIFLNTEMSAVVRPAGWTDWKKPETHQTARYAEYHSTGPGADPTNRVGWATQLTADEAAEITIPKVLGGWNPR
jgi:pectinesterase